MHDTVNDLIDRIASLQDENGCWNVLSPSDPHYRDANYYVPNYKSTLWTLILLADCKADPADPRFVKPLDTIADYFHDARSRIFTIGKGHFPIPCLNGNMIYLLSYFNSKRTGMIDDAVDFFNQYQRFDDGGYRTPRSYPYFGNKSCYGSHTCYWGVVKLLKGLVHIPKDRRTRDANELIEKAVGFILLHQVCFGSRSSEKLLHPAMGVLTFPNMYHADFLEVLWLLTKEGIRSPKMEKATRMLREKIGADGAWTIERPITDLIVPMGKRSSANAFISERAREVLTHHASNCVRPQFSPALTITE